MRSNIVNQLFKFCKIYQDCDKQCLITSDAENVPPFSVYAMNNGLTSHFRDIMYRKLIFSNTEDFYAVDVGFQHFIVKCFDY